MTKKSAGILPYRMEGKNYEVLLVHPGGPFWAKKDINSWSIPKGEIDQSEELLGAALREFKEETGFDAKGDFIELKPVRQPSGKIIYTWAVESDIDAGTIKSNSFQMEWPPKSGQYKQFPEVDRAEWFSFDMARNKIVKGQILILEELSKILGTGNTEPLLGEQM